MNILQALLSLDADAIASIEREEGFEHSGATPVIRQGSATWHVLRAVQQEVECAATFVAVSTSIANALSTSLNGRMSARALLTYTSPETPILAAALPRLIGGTELPELVRTCQDFEARLSLARRLSRIYANESKSAAFAQTVDLSALQDALAHACASAVRLLEAITAQTTPLAQGSNRNHALTGLLNDAAKGQHPCVERDGCIVVPGWAERRRDARQLIDMEVEILTSEGAYLARAFDASVSGFGLSQVPETARAFLTRGAQVRLKVPDGRSLDGKIAWTAGSKTGIQLNAKLP